MKSMLFLFFLLSLVGTHTNAYGFNKSLEAFNCKFPFIAQWTTMYSRISGSIHFINELSSVDWVTYANPKDKSFYENNSLIGQESKLYKKTSYGDFRVLYYFEYRDNNKFTSKLEIVVIKSNSKNNYQAIRVLGDSAFDTADKMIEGCLSYLESQRSS